MKRITSLQGHPPPPQASESEITSKTENMLIKQVLTKGRVQPHQLVNEGLNLVLGRYMYI